MTAKQITPLIATVAPPLLVGAAIYFALKWLFSAEAAETKPETASNNFKTTNQINPPEIGGNQGIPPHSAGMPNAAPGVSVVAPALIPPVSAHPGPNTPKPAGKALTILHSRVEALSPVKRRVVAREDLAIAFDNGAKSLTRTAAVEALKNFGFGKTAAYAALSPDGRFSDWMQFAPDGIITWKG